MPSSRPRRRSSPAESPKRLRFTGRADLFVAGVPQSDLEVVMDPVHHHQVTPERAADLIATGLYEPVKE